MIGSRVDERQSLFRMRAQALPAVASAIAGLAIYGARGAR
jgi:hypothetical protein